MDEKKNIRTDIKPEVYKSPKEGRNQNLYIDNRHKMTLSGILNVDSFNEEQIVVETDLGLLEIKGSSMHMSRLNLETGDLIIEGSIDSCAYSDRTGTKAKGAGFFSSLFK